MIKKQERNSLISHLNADICISKDVHVYWPFKIDEISQNFASTKA